MSTLPPTHAPGRFTSATLTGGVVVATACFIVAGVAEILGRDDTAGDVTDVAALLDGLVALSPWAWASLGSLAVIATPALGLLVTASEYASVEDRRAVTLALSVLAVLLAGALIAVAR